MNMAPISDPNTMMPAQAATQKMRRPATCRSYSGLAARRWRMTKPTVAAAAMTSRLMVSVPASGTAAKLMPRISAPTRTAESSPPRLSTGSVASFTWEGISFIVVGIATMISGTVTRKTEPHQNSSSSRPAMSGPIAEIAPPVADHSAIDFVRPGPDHSAVMRASVVGYAMPAASPPTIRATMSTSMVGAHAATRPAGSERATPSRSIILRP